MEDAKDYGGEPVRKDLGALLLLVAACPFGLLMWAALFSALQWTVIAVWGVAVDFAASPKITATTLAIPSRIPAPTVSRADPSTSSHPTRPVLDHGAPG
jgi:hypothetical protein